MVAERSGTVTVSFRFAVSTEMVGVVLLLRTEIRLEMVKVLSVGSCGPRRKIPLTAMRILILAIFAML